MHTKSLNVARRKKEEEKCEEIIIGKKRNFKVDI